MLNQILLDEQSYCSSAKESSALGCMVEVSLGFHACFSAASLGVRSCRAGCDALMS